jgi:hypothetical protein
VNHLIDGLSSAVSEKAALGTEMELAKKIQTCLLPKSPEIQGYDIAASCESADEVGGDYYDVISVGGYDWIVIGDVSGQRNGRTGDDDGSDRNPYGADCQSAGSAFGVIVDH